MLAAASSGAQTEVLTSVPVYTGVLIQTGLLTYATGENRSADVTVTELGAPGATSTVRVTFYDEADRAIFRDEGELQRGQPVHVVFPLHMPDGSVRLRASVLIVEKTGKKTLPVMVLESVDLGSFAIEERVSCSPPEDKEGVTPYCPPPAIATKIAVRQ
jgi:hypothetical protein